MLEARTYLASESPHADHQNGALGELVLKVVTDHADLLGVPLGRRHDDEPVP